MIRQDSVPKTVVSCSLDGHFFLPAPLPLVSAFIWLSKLLAVTSCLPTIFLGKLEAINLWKVKIVHCLSCKSRSGCGLQLSSPPFSPSCSPDLQLCQLCLMDPLNLLCRQGVNGAQTCLGMCNCTEIPVCVREGDMGQGPASHTVWSQKMQACHVYYTHTYIPLI